MSSVLVLAQDGRTAPLQTLPHTRSALLFKQWKKKAQSKIKGENTAAEGEAYFGWASGVEDDSRGW